MKGKEGIMTNSWISNHLPWILSMALGAGSFMMLIQVCQARIDKLDIEFTQHELDQRSLEMLPVKIEFILEQLAEIKVDIREIKKELQAQNTK